MERLLKHITYICVVIFFSVNISFAQQISYTKNELLGKIKPSTDSNFIKIASKYTNRTNIYLRKEAYDHYCQMYNAALKEGVKLTIVSAFRSYNNQKYLWENKWNGKVKIDDEYLDQNISDVEKAIKILNYSSMPGTSRHHWGTDVDIYSVMDIDFQTKQGKQVYNWLLANAKKYGYAQPYTTNRKSGYLEEKWHWSYLPTAKIMLDDYLKQISTKDINGFEGSETASDIKIITNYVLSINPECIKEK